MAETRGRPRSEMSRRAVLEATRDLLQGYDFERLSIDAIAARSNVSKATIYRWWRSRAAIVAEAIMSGYLDYDSVGIDDTANVAADLHKWLRASMISVAQPQTAALIRGMVALTAARLDHSDAAPQALLGPDAEALVHRLTVASERGEMRPDADVPTLASLLLGSILLRVLTDARSEPSAHAAFIVDSLLRGVAQSQG